MFEFKACEVLKAKELTHVNDWFQNERNAEVGHYRQALFIIFNLSNKQREKHPTLLPYFHSFNKVMRLNRCDNTLLLRL